MNEQWQELKETIIEMRDNDGIGTQQEVCKFLANYMDTLEKQITDGWIPCSERLPKDNGYYLTTTMYGEVYCDYWTDDSFDRQETVISWMPLPEPYKAESKIEQALVYADQDTMMPAT